MSPQVLAAALLTYLVHSTLLTAAAWIVARGTRSARVRELAWRGALVGGVLTTGLQLALSIGPVAGRWELPGASAQVASSFELPAQEPLRAELRTPDVAPRRSAPAAADWGALGLGAWLLAAGMSLAWTGLAVARWRRRMAHRRPLVEGPVVEALARLQAVSGLRRRVRLTVSPSLEAPIAWGVLRPEVSLPPRSLALEPALRDAMLAHELAHLARRDPLWLGLARALVTTFFFQPLHRVARRGMAECAEYLCDDWALARTRDRVGLARCLAQVAGWLVGEADSAPACAMADRRSPLGRRVERILDEARAPEETRAGQRLAVLAALVLTAWIAPGIAAAERAARVERRPRMAGPTPAEAPLGAESSAPGLAAAALERELAGLGLAELELALAELRALASERALSPELGSRVERLAERIAHLRAKEARVLELVARWSGRAPTAGDER